MRLVCSQQGITLIEVLIALFIFTVGLLGVSGLLIVSARSIHTAYLRTQTTFLAQSMAERMSANVTGVWKGYYNGDYPGVGEQSCEGGCTPQQLAEHDKGLWSSQLATFLPAAASAKISCGNAGLPYVPTAEQIALQPPYGGNCSMTITWAERGVTMDGLRSDKASTQTFAWEFQP